MLHAEEVCSEGKNCGRNYYPLPSYRTEITQCKYILSTRMGQ